MDKLIQIMTQEITVWLPKVAAVVVVIVLFFVLSRIIRGVIIRATRKLNIENHLAFLLARTSSVIIIIFGIVTALGTLGINVTAIVAGLGLTGFALGFALKDTISNLLSGILILLYQPFKIGNTIKLSGYEGKVVSIDLRYTELDSEGNRVLIPNSKLFTDPITVLSVK